jgi:hypothetical protein
MYNLFSLITFERVKMYELEDPQAPTKPKLPCPLADDPTFVYSNSASTDIQRTWRKFGWKPFNEIKGETK